MVRIAKHLEEEEFSLGSSREETVANKKMVLTVGAKGYLTTLFNLNDKNVEIAKLRM